MHPTTLFGFNLSSVQDNMLAHLWIAPTVISDLMTAFQNEHLPLLFCFSSASVSMPGFNRPRS